MIVPLTPETDWLPLLRTLPPFTPPAARTVVVVPHPDDETLGTGGLIALLRDQGTEVVVVAVTDGENAYEGVAGLGEVRAPEQAAALAELGVEPGSIVRLALTDSAVGAAENKLLRRLLAIVEPGDHVVAPWTGDFHPDHEACGRAAAAAVAATAGATLSFYFFWTWHRGTPATLAGLALQRLPLPQNTVQRRRLALAHHGSQLQHASGAPILPEDLLLPMDRPFEVYLPA